MELRHLRYFIAVAEELSFRRAAARLQMAQPPVSSQIADLEKELGVQLFSRRLKQISLTHAGRLFLIESRRTIAQAEKAAHIARAAARGEIGSIHIGYSRYMSTEVLPWLLRILRKRFPHLEVMPLVAPIHTIIDDLEAEKLDFGIVRMPMRSIVLDSKTVLLDRLVAVIPADHPLAKHNSIPLRSLRDETFVVIDRSVAGEYSGMSLRACKAVGFSPSRTEKADSLPGQFAMVAAGRAVAVVPASASASAHIHAWPELKVVELNDTDVRADLAVAWRKGEIPDVCRLVVAELNRIKAILKAGAPWSP